MLAPHEVLGLPVDANEDEILTVRRVLVRKTQPDEVGSPQASEQMQAINTACDAMLASLAESGRNNRTVETYASRAKRDASFQAPYRMVPSQDMRRKMEAALLGYIRQSGTGSNVGHAVVDRLDFIEDTVRFRLESRPEPGRVLVAVPRLVQDGPGALRQESQTALIEIEVSEVVDANIQLSQAGARKCVANVRGLSVEIQVPS